jgi:GTP-binding protein EngB required for normal cell division
MIVRDTASIASETVAETLNVIEGLCKRHGISALDDFLESCRTFAQEKTLNVAVLGRFKAGKSSFLNHLLGRPLLPVGVIPVTSVVTEIQWGLREGAEVVFGDGRRDQVSTDRIAEFISENENPENRKQVARVRIELPEMERYRWVRFVDTPGLESAFEHNTDASLDWLPNVGLALVAVGVDPPLSRHDIELIRSLSHYTPNISLLLTKVDVLDEDEREQVREFVQKQLARYWHDAVPVFPYSVRPGFESLRSGLDEALFSQVRAGAGEHYTAILLHKVDSLATECAGYLNVALRSAEVADSDREELRRKVLGQKEALDDTRLALKLVVRHATGTTRTTFEGLLRDDEIPVRRKLQSSLDLEFPKWTSDLRTAIEKFDDWLRAGLSHEMSELSRKHRAEFAKPARAAARQLSQALQDFRNRLSDRMLENLGVPLRTTEMDLHTEEPKSPDVRVGKIFDRNWELLSWLIPMGVVQGTVMKHYRRKVEDAVFKNLSRLVTQWEDVANAALRALEQESLRRLNGLVVTVEKLIAAAGQEAPQIRQDLELLEGARRRMTGGS